MRIMLIVQTIAVWFLMIIHSNLRSEYAKAEKDKVWYCKQYNRMYNDSVQAYKDSWDQYLEFMDELPPAIIELNNKK